MSEAKTTPLSKNDFFSGGLMAHILTQQSSSKSLTTSSLVKENTAASAQSPQISASVKPIIFRRAVATTFPISANSAANTHQSASTAMQNKSGGGTTSYAVIATGSASGGAGNNNQSTPSQSQMPLYQLHTSSAANDHQQSGGQQQSQQQVASQYQHAAAAFDYGAPHTLYAQTAPAYYQHHQSSGGGGAGGNQSGGATPGQVLYSSGAYILQTTTSVDGDSHTLAHTTRASPATVQWLVDNYETSDGVSLPRSTIYAHYMRHCEEEKLEPMNPASFGKLIRSVFLGLRTRRLGTRGNSKYHYYGIRIKASSPLVNISEDMIMAAAGRQYSSPPQQKKFGNRPGMSGGRFDGSAGGQTGTTTITVIGTPAPIAASVAHQVGPVGSASAAAAAAGIGEASGNNNGAVAASTVSPQQQFLGDVTLALPRFEVVDVAAHLLSPDVSEHDVRVFEQLYREHCESLVDLVVNLQFNLIEQLWASFWRGGDSSTGMRGGAQRASGVRSMGGRNGGGDFVDEDDDEEVDEEVDDDEEDDEDGQARPSARNMKPNADGSDAEARLPRMKLAQIISLPFIQLYMRRIDAALYQSLVYTLLPDLLRPIPSSLTQAIRNFAKGMESWLRNAMNGMPEDAVRSKLGPAVAFAQTLRRYTSLNHLAQAARAVLQNQEHLQQMVADLNRVDFVNVQEQAAWVTSCETKVVRQIETDLKRLLSIENSLDNWAAWLESVVDMALQQQPQQNASLSAEKQAQALAEASRSFLLKWSFYNSMVIRDLTLRSAHSFGSFHLIRLLFDEYIYFVLEHRVAHAVREVPIAVLDASRGGTDVPLAEPLYSLDIMQARADLRGPRLYPVVSATLQAAATAQQLAATAAAAVGGTATGFHLAPAGGKTSSLIITPASSSSGGFATPGAPSGVTSRPSTATTNKQPSIITLTASSSPASGGIKVGAPVSGISSRSFAPASVSGGIGSGAVTTAVGVTSASSTAKTIYVVPVGGSSANNNNNNNNNGNNNNNNNNTNSSEGGDGSSQPPIKRIKDDVSPSPVTAANSSL